MDCFPQRSKGEIFQIELKTCFNDLKSNYMQNGGDYFLCNEILTNSTYYFKQLCYLNFYPFLTIFSTQYQEVPKAFLVNYFRPRKDSLSLQSLYFLSHDLSSSFIKILPQRILKLLFFSKTPPGSLFLLDVVFRGGTTSHAEHKI